MGGGQTHRDTSYTQTMNLISVHFFFRKESRLKILYRAVVPMVMILRLLIFYNFIYTQVWLVCSYYVSFTVYIRQPGSSVSDYGRSGPSGFDPRQRQEDFYFSLWVKTGTGIHPASCKKGIRGSFPGAKARPERNTDRSLHLLLWSRMSRSYTLPTSASMACCGTALAL
jgi:hypothetical protein